VLGHCVCVCVALVFADDAKMMKREKKKKEKKKKKKNKNRSRSRSTEAVKPSTADHLVSRDALPLIQVKSEFQEDSGKHTERHLEGHKNDIRIKMESDKRREVGSSDSLYQHRRPISPRRCATSEKHDSRNFSGSQSESQSFHLERKEDRSRTLKTNGTDRESGLSSKHDILRTSQQSDQRYSLDKRQMRSNSLSESEGRQRLQNSRAALEQSRHHRKHKSTEFTGDGRKRHRRSSSESSSDNHGRREKDGTRDRLSYNEQRNDSSDMYSRKQRHHNVQ